jgi:hypothetical protein
MCACRLALREKIRTVIVALAAGGAALLGKGLDA